MNTKLHTEHRTILHADHKKFFFDFFRIENRSGENLKHTLESLIDDLKNDDGTYQDLKIRFPSKLIEKAGGKLPIGGS